MKTTKLLYFWSIFVAFFATQNLCYSYIQKNSIKKYGNIIFKNYENLILKNKIEKKNIFSNPLFSAISLDDTGENIRKRNLLNPLYTSLSKPVLYGPHVKIKGKILNMWGVMYALTTFTVAVVVLPFMVVLSYISDLRGNGKQRRVLDWVIHIWAQTALRLSLCVPKVYGFENLPKNNETVVYVPNHTSFIDILIMSGAVPRPFKYLSKSEILDIPVIGWAMKLAKHVFLKRDDLRSTLEVTDTCVERLRDGNSLVLFAEGTRSPDGSLKAFKKGAFQMAKAAGVKVIPVSIGNLHRWMPSSALLPLAPIRHVYVKIHPAIDTQDIPVSKIRALCHEAVNAGLPPYQRENTMLPSI
mmetsp:Transcript_5910/g.6030  ORF Transcript_5910/g.6030 Transcript_5910/m.6030 type:complete len:356 (-) Transcript_5910:86-1153(-)